MSVIGVLTAGGDCPGLNAVVRAVAKSAFGKGWDVLGIEDGFEGFYREGGIRPLSRGHVRGILQTGGSILRCSNRGNPFRFPVEEGSSEMADRSDEVVETVDRLGLDALVVIGGDGSLSIASRLQAKGVPGLPLTGAALRAPGQAGRPQCNRRLLSRGTIYRSTDVVIAWAAQVGAGSRMSARVYILRGMY